METIEYRTFDKSTWGEGEWQDEPDKKQWLDKETGLPCLIVRNQMGSLCGYAGVPSGHPFFGKDWQDVDSLDAIKVHWGLTFSGHCQEHQGEADGICHKVDDEQPVWWLGFDCAHAGDLSPRNEAARRESGCQSLYENPYWKDTYKNLAFVTAEVESLAKQLKKLGLNDYSCVEK